MSRYFWFLQGTCWSILLVVAWLTGADDTQRFAMLALLISLVGIDVSERS